MSNSSNPPIIYQIRLQGHLGEQWAVWFEDLTITLEDDGNTLLTGAMLDQAAMYGVLRKMRDLGMRLVSVDQVQSHETRQNHSNKE